MVSTLNISANHNEIFRRAFEDAPSEVFAFGASTLKFTIVNARARSNLQYSIKELRNLTPVDIKPEFDEASFRDIIKPLVSGQKDRIEFRTQHLRRDGSGYEAEILLQYIAGDLPQFLALILDVTAENEAKIETLRAKDQLKTAIEALPDGFVLYDRGDRLVVCNEKYREFYPKSASIMVPGAKFEDILRHGLARGEYADAVGRENKWLKERLQEHRQANNVIEQKLSDDRWLRILERATPDGGRVGLRIDITQQMESRSRAEQAAATDSLTGLANRRGVTRFSGCAARSLKPKERLIALHVDLDKFKSINDVIGHDAGDFVLVEAAKVLCASVGKGGLVARVGGDEFLVLLQSDMKNPQVMEFSERLRRELSEPIRFRGRICHIGASIGISSWSPGSDISIETALLNADIALNHCKKHGRNRSSLFEQSMRVRTVETAVLAQEIKKGISAGEFVPFFQPQFDISGQNIDGFEVLVRWRHPTRGLLSAGDFLFAAEEHGLVSVIDQIVLQKSLPVLKRMSVFEFMYPRMSLNMSGAQLSDPGIVEQYMWQILGHSISPDQIRIEILESTLLDDRAVNVIENIRAFSENGLAIELDDFGTGHTAISSLTKYPVQRIKIDRSLVKDIDSDPALHAITDAIVGLAKKLSIKVLAEGVETAKELMTLQGIGCTCVQGFYLAHPMAEEEVFDWLRSRDKRTLVSFAQK